MEKKVIKSWSKHNLPEDLWREILSRLPVKSLLRFRCVSKSWRSMIDDPDFSRLHLDRFNNNRHETHLFVVQGKKFDCVLRCSPTFKTTARLGSLAGHDDCLKAFRKSPQTIFAGCFRFICSIDGLVLLGGLLDQRSELVLWNPSIRRARSLNPPRTPNEMRRVDLGLGFDPLIRDYKHVRFTQILADMSPHSVLVYTLGMDLWKTIRFQGKGRSSWRWHWPVIFHGTVETVCFRGRLFFIARFLNSDASELVSFDLSYEVFESTSLPVDDDVDCRSSGFSEVLMLADGGCSLALFNFNLIQGSIWVLEGSAADTESMNWTKRYTFAMRVPEFLYLKKNGDILLGRKQVTSYNPETSQEKVLLKNSRCLRMQKVRGYIESLIWLR